MIAERGHKMGTQNRFEEAIKNNRKKLLVKVLVGLAKECVGKYLTHKSNNQMELANYELSMSNTYDNVIHLIMNDNYLIKIADELNIIL